MSRKQNAEEAISALMRAHESYCAAWAKNESPYFPAWISPRGKECSYHEMRAAINARLAKTIQKIITAARERE